MLKTISYYDTSQSHAPTDPCRWADSKGDSSRRGHDRVAFMYLSNERMAEAGALAENPILVHNSIISASSCEEAVSVDGDRSFRGWAPRMYAFSSAEMTPWCWANGEAVLSAFLSAEMRLCVCDKGHALISASAEILAGVLSWVERSF
jgi:hypothetical protein